MDSSSTSLGNSNDIDLFLHSPVSSTTDTSTSMPHKTQSKARPKSAKVSKALSYNAFGSPCCAHGVDCYGEPIEKGTPFQLASPINPDNKKITICISVNELIKALKASMSFPFHPTVEEYLNSNFSTYCSNNISSSKTKRDINGKSRGDSMDRWKRDMKRRILNRAVRWLNDIPRYGGIDIVDQFSDTSSDDQFIAELDILLPKSKVILVEVSKCRQGDYSSPVPSRLGVVYGTYRIPDTFYSFIEEEVEDNDCLLECPVSFSFEAEGLPGNSFHPYFGHVTLWRPRENRPDITDNFPLTTKRYPNLCEPLPFSCPVTDGKIVPSTGSWRRILGVRCKYCRSVVANCESSYHLKRYHPQHESCQGRVSTSSAMEKSAVLPSSPPVQHDSPQALPRFLCSKSDFPLCRCAYCCSQQKDTSPSLTSSIGVLDIFGDSQLFYSLKIQRKLGQGAQGDVWLMSSATSRCSSTGSNIFALKCIAVSELLSGDLKDKPRTPLQLENLSSESIFNKLEKRADALYCQACMCAQLKNDHIIDYLCVVKGCLIERGYSQSSATRAGHPMVIIVMPYYPEGDLAQFIRATSPIDLDHILISSFILQIASALRYMHEGHGLVTRRVNEMNRIGPVTTNVNENNPFIHGDIKPENILLKNNKTQVVLMDLDTIRKIKKYNDHSNNEEEGIMPEVTGTFEWMAPECHNQDINCTYSLRTRRNGVDPSLIVLPNNPASDIWSLGQLFFVLLTLPEYVDLPCPVAVPPDTPCFLSSSTWWNHNLTRPFDQRDVISLFSSLNSKVLENQGSLVINSSKSRFSTRWNSGMFSGGNFAMPLPNERELYGDRDWPLIDVLRFKMSSCGCPEGLQLIVLKMLRADYRKRPSASTVAEELQAMMEKLLLGETYCA